jgi:hypothetical protein
LLRINRTTNKDRPSPAAAWRGLWLVHIAFTAGEGEKRKRERKIKKKNKLVREWLS